MSSTHPLAPLLSTKERRELEAFQHIKQFTPRSIIFSKDSQINSIYLIKIGSVRLERKGLEKSDVVFAFKKRRDFLGIFSYLKPDAKHIASAVTLENTTVYFYEKNTFLSFIENTPSLEAEIRKQLATSFTELQIDRYFAIESTQKRLANILLKLFFDNRSPSNNTIPIPLSKADLAKRIGAEPATVVRIFNSWKKTGLVRSKDKIVEICDLKKLESIVDRRF